jgi:hypothetical protein
VNTERQPFAFVLFLFVGKLNLICGSGYRLKADATEGDVEFSDFPEFSAMVEGLHGT